MPHNSQDSPDTADSDRTLSTGGPGGATAGHIGPYHLLQKLGEGGMGEVWLAEQKKPIHRTVALKLIKAGMDTKTVVARFESERQALALMDHPNIARVFDAGSTTEGRPFFVMEYVPGLPITEYCDKHRLTVKERLELFIQVCDGVQHAHQKAIIHRDLKPSNVLVVEHDNKPVPKIIDFGLAKATAQRLTDTTMFTELGVMLGTPEYMSPEQADLREQNIDTRTDVYSLGVILYQLLVGVLPFDSKAMRAAGIDAILRAIREEEPPRPSTRVRAMGEGSKASAEKRREEPRSFARRLRGELDWITMKALEKDRVRRYGSAADLGADVQRYLRNEPIVAHPPNTLYRASKYIRRHRLGVSVAGVAVLLLIAFAITEAVQIRRITRERDRADRIADFMTNMFKAPDPKRAHGNTVTAREILDKASTDIGKSLGNDPELQAKLMYTMGGTYHSLGLYPQAQELYGRAIEIQGRLLGPRHPDTLMSELSLATALSDAGHYPEAEKEYREALAARRRVVGIEDRHTPFYMGGLAMTLMSEGRYAEAEQLQREALNIARRLLGPEDRYTLQAMNNLAAILVHEGRLTEAAALEREIIAIQRRVFGPDDPLTLQAMNGLAVTLKDTGNYTEAETMERDIITRMRRVLGPENEDTLTSISNLALILSTEGKYAEAEKLQLETLDIQSRTLGPTNTDTLVTMINLSDTYMQQEHWAQAEKLSRETYKLELQTLGAEHPYTLICLENIAIDASHQGRYAEAQELFRKAIDTATKTRQPGVLEDTWYNFAGMAAGSGHREEAFEYLAKAIDLGYSNADGMEVEKSLQALHGDPRFAALVAKARQNVQAAQKSN